MIRKTALAFSDNYYIDDDKQPLHVEKKPKHILLIEDNKSDVFLIRKMLRDAVMGEVFDFTDVARMVDALALLDEHSFDLIIVDLSLLDIDGSATVAALHAGAPHIPIIVHTGAQCPRLREEAILCGARHYLIKGRESPFSFRFMVQQALVHAEM